MTTDLLGAIRTSLSASSTAIDPDVAILYCGAARVAFGKLLEEVKALEHVLIARERALAHSPAQPRELFAAERA